MIKPNSANINLKFSPDENKVNEFIATIKDFGEILISKQCSICNSFDNLRKCLCKKIFA